MRKGGRVVYIIGLTGPSGSGKGLVSKELSRLGAAVIDADDVYHALIGTNTACTQELALQFGDQILNSDGGIDRKKLANIVFCRDEGREGRLSRLNSITHRHVLEELQHRIAQLESSCDTVIVDAPTLIESGFHRECDAVIAVLANRDLRLARITTRDHLDHEAAARRIDAQPADRFYTEQADHIIENNGSAQALSQQVSDVWNSVNKQRKQSIT